MMNKEENKKQRALIRAFDKELFSYTGQIAWLMPGIFSTMLLAAMLIPAQEITTDNRGALISFVPGVMWIPYTVLLPYLDTTDSFTRRKGKSTTFQKLQYLPVSKRQYNIVRLGYLYRYLWKLTLIGLVIQCIVSSVAYGGIGPMNFLYVVGLLFILPMGLGCLLIFISR